MGGSGRRRKKHVMKGGKITTATGRESAYSFANAILYPTIGDALTANLNHVVIFKFVGPTEDPGLSDRAFVINKTDSRLVSPDIDRTTHRHDVNFGAGPMLLNPVDYATLMDPTKKIFVYNVDENGRIIHGGTDVNSSGLLGFSNIAELNAALAAQRLSATSPPPYPLYPLANTLTGREAEQNAAEWNAWTTWATANPGNARMLLDLLAATSPPPYPLYPLANTLTGREAEQNAAEWNAWTTWATANPGNARMLLDLLPPRLRHGGARAGSRTLPTRRAQRSTMYNVRRTHRHKY